MSRDFYSPSPFGFSPSPDPSPPPSCFELSLEDVFLSVLVAASDFSLTGGGGGLFFSSFGDGFGKSLSLAGFGDSTPESSEPSSFFLCLSASAIFFLSSASVNFTLI